LPALWPRRFLLASVHHLQQPATRFRGVNRIKEVVRRLGPLRVLERRQMRKEAEKAVAQLSLTRIRSAEQPVWTLSGGERQSVAITRAIYFGAKLLLQQT
jgi:ABC-type sugar transport system ATPase subunit